MNGDFHLGRWLVQPTLNAISDNGTSVRLEPKLMQVLVFLSRSAGETLSKEQILTSVWPETFVSDDVLSRAISELRKALQDDAREPRFIQTVAKRGYRLIVTPIEAAVGSNLGNGPESRMKQATVKAMSRDRTKSGALLLSLVILGLLAFVFARSVRARGDGQPIRSVAVLPFKNLSGDSSREYFADGMTEELIADLSQLSALKVISYTSVNRYKESSKSLAEIARELGVDSVIEGSVMRVGPKIRITARLVRVPDDKTLLANTYEGQVNEVLSLENKVAESTAEGVRLELTPREKQRISVVHSPVPEALDAYWQGLYHCNRYGNGFGKEERIKAIEYFERATRLDPHFAPAYVGVVDAHTVNVLPRPEEFEIARISLEKALVADPDLSAAHVWLARFLEFHDWDFTGAGREFRRAIQLDPNNARAHDFFGDYLENMGLHDQGSKEDEIAQQLDPNCDHLSDGYNHRGDYNRALHIVLNWAGTDPSNGSVEYSLYQDYMRLGLYERAVMEIPKLTAAYGYPEMGRRVMQVYKSSGVQAALRLWAKELEGADPAPPTVIAEVYLHLDDKENAFAWLEKAYQQRDGFIVSLRDPVWAPLASDPRYTDLVRRIGLPN